MLVILFITSWKVVSIANIKDYVNGSFVFFATIIYDSLEVLVLKYNGTRANKDEIVFNLHITL